MAVESSTIGMALVMFTAWLQSTGLAVTRMAELEQEQLKKQNKQQPEGRNVKAIAGVVMNFLSQPLNAVALTFCSASVVGALASSVNITNSMFWGWYQGERLGRESWVAMFLGIIGCLGIIYLAPGGDSLKLSCRER